MLGGRRSPFTATIWDQVQLILRGKRELEPAVYIVLRQAEINLSEFLISRDKSFVARCSVLAFTEPDFFDLDT